MTDDIGLMIAKLEAELEVVFEKEQLGHPTRRTSKEIKNQLYALYADQDRATYANGSYSLSPAQMSKGRTT